MLVCVIALVLMQKNSAIVSRILKEALKDGVIKAYDTGAGAKAMRYIPAWA